MEQLKELQVKVYRASGMTDAQYKDEQERMMQMARDLYPGVKLELVLAEMPEGLQS